MTSPKLIMRTTHSRYVTWKAEVLALVRNYWGDGQEFTLKEVYAHGRELQSLHPMNRNIEAKIRQTLQSLRSARLVEFIDEDGTYRVK